MTKKIVILIIIWLVFVFADYFYLPYFVQPFSWLLVCITLLVLLIREIMRKSIKTTRIINLSITLILLFLTFYNFNKIPHSAIEKIDWTIFYNKRKQIVNEVLAERLKDNTKMNSGICKLPFDFPIISNGGNEIWIYKDKTQSTKTIKFWISRGFFESPQTYFIFTNDNETIKRYQELIKTKPEHNWKLEENWYRIMERD